MLKTFSILIITLSMLSCSESKLDICKKKANKLWNSSSSEKHKNNNSAYWSAIKRCEKKHG